MLKRDRSDIGDTSRRDTGDTLIIPIEEYSTGVAGVTSRNLRSNSLIHEDPNLRHGFTQIPNAVLNDKRLTPTDFRVYCLLLKYSWQSGQCFPGQDRLALDMDCNIRTVKRSIQHLVALKLIRIQRLGQGKANIYYIRRLSDSYAIFDNKPIGVSK